MTNEISISIFDILYVIQIRYLVLTYVVVRYWLLNIPFCKFSRAWRLLITNEGVFLVWSHSSRKSNLNNKYFWQKHSKPKCFKKKKCLPSALNYISLTCTVHLIYTHVYIHIFPISIWFAGSADHLINNIVFV